MGSAPQKNIWKWTSFRHLPLHTSHYQNFLRSLQLRCNPLLTTLLENLSRRHQTLPDMRGDLSSDWTMVGGFPLAHFLSRHNKQEKPLTSPMLSRWIRWHTYWGNTHQLLLEDSQSVKNEPDIFRHSGTPLEIFTQTILYIKNTPQIWTE